MYMYMYMHVLKFVINISFDRSAWHTHITVDREIFAFKYFRVINVGVSNFRHKVQEVKILHGVLFSCVKFSPTTREAKIF